MQSSIDLRVKTDPKSLLPLLQPKLTVDVRLERGGYVMTPYHHRSNRHPLCPIQTFYLPLPSAQDILSLTSAQDIIPPTSAQDTYPWGHMTTIIPSPSSVVLTPQSHDHSILLSAR
jgi:hypothetical protein